jgi:hypothetical protein
MISVQHVEGILNLKQEEENMLLYDVAINKFQLMPSLLDAP